LLIFVIPRTPADSPVGAREEDHMYAAQLLTLKVDFNKGMLHTGRP
jgi:hypothetical protein